MKPRRDYETAKLIDATIALMTTRGAFAAARSLYEAGVPFETARRVLVHPTQRRTYGDALLH